MIRRSGSCIANSLSGGPLPEDLEQNDADRNRHVQRCHLAAHWDRNNRIAAFADQAMETGPFAAEDQRRRSGDVEFGVGDLP